MLVVYNVTRRIPVARLHVLRSACRPLATALSAAAPSGRATGSIGPCPLVDRTAG